MPRKWQAWTAEDDALLRRLYPSTPTGEVAKALGRSLTTVYQRAYTVGLSKSAEYLNSPAACRLDGVKGASTRFQKGQRSWNKGLHYQPGGRVKETQFKKGEINGRARQLVQPLGAYRVNADGYLDRKVREDGPPQYRWTAVHRLVWIEAHGPVPDGYVVCFKAGRRSTVLEEITIDALELVSRVDLMKRNTVHNLPKEIAQLVQLRGALVRQINKRETGA